MILLGRAGGWLTPESCLLFWQLACLLLTLTNIVDTLEKRLYE